MTCPEVAALLGDAPRTVEYWIRGFEEKGLAALALLFAINLFAPQAIFTAL